MKPAMTIRMRMCLGALVLVVLLGGLFAFGPAAATPPGTTVPAAALATAQAAALATVQAGALATITPAALATVTPANSAGADDDPYQWLEDVRGEKSLAWVRAHNETTTKALASDPGFDTLRARLLAAYESKDRIPYASVTGEYLYNFWRDDQHIRGILRRTSMASYKTANPDWEIVIDLDKLAEEEKESWVWSGFDVLEPDHDRCLLRLSRGGGDAEVIREFDLREKKLVPGGFSFPEGKTFAAWRTRDTLYVGADFGPGSLTEAGYPRIVKLWARNTPLTEAKTIFEGPTTDSYNSGFRIFDRGVNYDMIVRGMTAYTNETLIQRGSEWVKLDKQDDAEVSTFADQILITLRTDWPVGGRTYAAGSMLAAPIEDFLAGKRDFAVLFEPNDHKSLAGASGTLHHLIINEMEDVHNKLYVATLENGKWTRVPLPAPAMGTVTAYAVDPLKTDDYWMTVADFLTPSTLSFGTIGGGPAEKVKSLTAYFDATGLKVEQDWAVSKDGTRVPYFMVSRENTKRDGENVTLLYGYGGFEVTYQPFYSAGVGISWLERGGIYVLANIRGGGEFGPKWHQAAVKANRQKAYDDFIAVAEDLIAKKITSPKKLGIEGGSNGGHLMGMMLIERPDLFGAIVAQVPLLDMKRYSHLLAGASWMAEYGDPDKPEEWAFLQKYSPYQLVQKDQKYPPVLFTTSTADDRVHPSHARKMVAKMLDQGHEVYYYENIEGGHATAANNPQRAFMTALEYRFLARELGLK
jgi:prolyl oligopeptidase